MLNVEQAHAIMTFMQRAQIMGSEAPAFMQCMFALKMIAEPPTAQPMPPAPPAPAEPAATAAGDG